MGVVVYPEEYSKKTRIFFQFLVTVLVDELSVS